MKKVKDWFVYIVKCSDNTCYTGVTNNIEKRIEAHNSGKGSKYTKARIPVTLVWMSESKEKSEAFILEYKIKQLTRKQKLEMIHGRSDGFRLNFTKVDESVQLT